MREVHLGHDDNGKCSGFVCAHIFAISECQKTNRLTNNLVTMHCNDEDKRAIGAESSSEFDGVTLEDGFGGKKKSG